MDIVQLLIARGTTRVGPSSSLHLRRKARWRTDSAAGKRMPNADSLSAVLEDGKRHSTPTSWQFLQL
jgi:hypothetical protein